MQTHRSIQWKRIREITLVWMGIGLFITLYDHFLLLSDMSAGFSPDYTILKSLGGNLFAGFAGGLMGGTALIEINERFRAKPYIQGIWISAGFFFLIVLIITLIISMFAVFFNFDRPFTDPRTREYFLYIVFSTRHLKNILLWGAVTIITQWSLQISDKFGPKNLWRMLTGKYHFPIKENRIFMFLDLKSSTSIAEKLGEEAYHEFLKEVFQDITVPILNSKAEIYQYVGDEVVVSWDISNIDNPQNCFTCYYEIEKALEEKKDSYLERFEVHPAFKAGAHYGQVIAGEIGIIKREITYSGDVLNTTARIQSQCNALKSRLLISHKLKEFIQADHKLWRINSKGFISLKGKEQELELYSVDQLVMG